MNTLTIDNFDFLLIIALIIFKIFKDSENEEVCDKKNLKARAWDDWKDENEKGGGNKGNSR